MEHLYYVPARQNDKVLLTMEQLFILYNRKPKDVSLYKYRDAIHKDVKFILNDYEIKINNMKRLVLNNEMTTYDYGQQILSLLNNALKKNMRGDMEMNKSKKHIKMEREKTLFQLFKNYLEFIHYKNKDRPQKTLDELLGDI